LKKPQTYKAGLRYLLGQTFGPVIPGRIFDLRHSYDLAWLIITAAGIVKAAEVFLISSPASSDAELKVSAKSWASLLRVV